MKDFKYRFFLMLWKGLSLLPLRLHYFLSDVLIFPSLYYVSRYRRPLVHQQLASCFPERTEEERSKIEKDFYHWLADYFVETIKAMTMSRTEMMRRMHIEGVEQLEAEMQAEGRQFAFLYLGHYGNWEWIASLPYWAQHTDEFGQIYHPLHNRVADRLFLRMRARAGATNIPMRHTLRTIIEWKRAGKKGMVGFIADQLPKWEAMYHWRPFLHHDTSFMPGAEQIGTKVGAAYYYADITRPRRGYYHCVLRRLDLSPHLDSPYPATDAYSTALEQSIRQHPHLWLWTHNRWKRTREQWEEFERHRAIKR